MTTDPQPLDLRQVTVSVDGFGDVVMSCPGCGPFFEMPPDDPEQGTTLTLAQLIDAVDAHEHEVNDGD